MEAMRSLLSSIRSRWLFLLSLLLVIAITLGWWRPWQTRPSISPRQVALIPTPTLSVPTPFRQPEHIALPPVTPVATPATSVARATPASVSGGTRGRGVLLYVGTYAGQEGIIAAVADGSGQRILVLGQYEAVSWSPDGERFAAVGPLQSGITMQVAIFAPDGRALARYPFEGKVSDQLLWSPDGSKLAGSVTFTAGDTPGQAMPTETWQIAPQGGVRRVVVPDTLAVLPFAWLPSGNLAVTSYESTGARTLWMVSEDGSTVVRQVSGDYAPLALSRDGEILYALGQPAATAASVLVAINLRTDVPRVIADADRLGALAGGALTVPGRYMFMSATVAPDEAHLAVVIEPTSLAGTPVSMPTLPERLLIFLGPDGGITGFSRLPAGAWPERFSWSPDGALLAFFSTGATTNELVVADTRGVRRVGVSFYVSGLYGGPRISWSSDSRWLAYASLAGIGIVSPSGVPSSELTSSGGFPAWQPVSRP